MPDDMVVVLKVGSRIGEKGAQALLALDQGPREQIFAVEVKEIEEEEDEPRRSRCRTRAGRY